MQCPVCNTPNLPSATCCITCASPLQAVSAPTSHLLPPGTRLHQGLYSIGKVLGQGGFGITYLGSDTRLQRMVAIKEFFPQGCLRQTVSVQTSGSLTAADFQSAKGRFLDEARVLAQFQHSGIVHVYTSFEENNTAYMVMEALKGKTLMSLVEQRGSLPAAEALRYIQQVGEALEVVHQAKLLHRDIKPENIIVTDEGRVVLLDFGTAREFAAGRTHRMTAMLTPGYAPLEQYGQQARFGVFTDVYALGSTFYHLLTGQVPVQATDRAAGVTLPAPHRINSSVPAAISDAVMWALEMKVDRRPQAVRDFLNALQNGAPPAAARKTRDSTKSVTAPPPRRQNPHEPRIRRALEELERPAPHPPPSAHDVRLAEVRALLARVATVAQVPATQCPGCAQGVLHQVTGQPDGKCPLCRRAALAKRQLDPAKCPVCRSGRIQEVTLPDDLCFCPVCRVVPLKKERRKQFGFAIDLWWNCGHCGAEWDVLTGGRAKLMRTREDPYGMSRLTGQILPISNWRKLSERSNSYSQCTSCTAELAPADPESSTLVRVAADPHGVGAKWKGKRLPNLAWSKLAQGLPAEVGELHCPVCSAEFDQNPTIKTLTLLRAQASFPQAQQWRGRPIPISTWYFAAAGKRSQHPGLLCHSCRTEFDDSPGGLKLIWSSQTNLSPSTGQSATLQDWHRRARRVPTVVQEKALRQELLRLETALQQEHATYTLGLKRQREQLEAELAGACKQSMLAGFIPITHQAPNVRLKGAEEVRWETHVVKLKQRTSQGVPYWDPDGEGRLVVTNERLMFDGNTPSVWQRALTKVAGVQKEYVRGLTVPVLVVWIDGVQKPFGFAVPNETLKVTVGSRATEVSVGVDDLVIVLESLR